MAAPCDMSRSAILAFLVHLCSLATGTLRLLDASWFLTVLLSHITTRLRNLLHMCSPCAGGKLTVTLHGHASLTVSLSRRQLPRQALVQAKASVMQVMAAMLSHVAEAQWLLSVWVRV